MRIYFFEWNKTNPMHAHWILMHPMPEARRVECTRAFVDWPSVNNFVDNDFFRHVDKDHALATMKNLKNIEKIKDIARVVLGI